MVLGLLDCIFVIATYLIILSPDYLEGHADALKPLLNGHSGTCNVPHHCMYKSKDRRS